MGIYDRDYYRAAPPRGGFGYFNAWSVTTWLIVVNVAIFFLDGLLHRMSHPTPVPWDYEPTLRDQMGPLEYWGYFSTATAIGSGQVWRFITFQFLHASPGHLFGNMIALYFFGPIGEAHFGARRYFAFYLLCGLAGAASYLLLAAGNVLETTGTTPLVGASAGIFGLLVAAAMIAPDVQIYIFMVPITIRMLAIFGMVLAAYTVFALGPAGDNAGGEAAHLGGGVLGFLFMKNQHWLSAFSPGRRIGTTAGSARSAPVARTGRRRKPRPFQKDWSKDFNR